MDIIIGMRKVQGLADAAYHMLRRTQDEKPRRLDRKDCLADGFSMGRVEENSPAHGLHAVRFLLGRLAGDDAVLINEQAVIDDTVDIPFVRHDQGMITLPCPAGTDKTGNMHHSSSFLSACHDIDCPAASRSYGR